MFQIANLRNQKILLKLFLAINLIFVLFEVDWYPFVTFRMYANTSFSFFQEVSFFVSFDDIENYESKRAIELFPPYEELTIQRIITYIQQQNNMAEHDAYALFLNKHNQLLCNQKKRPIKYLKIEIRNKNNPEKNHTLTLKGFCDEI